MIIFQSENILRQIAGLYLRFSFSTIYICILIIFCIPSFSIADSLTTGNIDASKTPWHINAQQITYNRNTNIYTATGQVKIYNEDKTLLAESVVFNHDTMEAASKDNVILTVGDDTLSGDEININLETGLGIIYNGRLFIEKKHFFIKGDKILKTGENSYAVNKGSLTACDGDVPAWQITGNNLDVTIEDYGSVSHAALWAKKIPVFYVPYFIFPLKLKRQSGLLTPQIGYSNRNGLEFIQPYFWAINQQSDSTFYYHHLQERGEKIGLEYRYALSPQSKATLMADYLEDRRIDDGTGDSSERWGYTNDNVLRENSDRYWLRMKLDQACPYQFKTKLDLDIVSDQDYLREFSDGYTGYDNAKHYFNSEFGRDIDDDNDPVRKNSLAFSKYGSQYSFNAEAIWYDNVIKRRNNEEDSTLQQLPSVMFSALKQPISSNMFFVNMDSAYKNFYREDGDTGHRIDIHPRIYLPLRFHNYFTLEPSAGFRQTAWYLDSESSDSETGNGYQHREIYDLKADLTTDIFAVFDLPEKFGLPDKPITKIKHTITPKLEYNYIPDTSQPVMPGFDNTDQIDPENLMTFSITNLLISKHKGSQHPDTSQPDTSQIDTTGIINNGETSSAADRYNQFFRFKIEQSYDFNKENMPGEKPFYPLYAELDLTPENILTLHAEAEWNHDHGELLSHNVYCKFKSNRNDHLLIEHRYTRDENQSIYLNFNGAITQNIRIFGNYERNLESGEDIETGIGCLYRAQCWSVALSFKDEQNDQKIAAMITLYGLGEAGNRL